jgi:hypothetical protein
MKMVDLNLFVVVEHQTQKVLGRAFRAEFQRRHNAGEMTADKAAEAMQKITAQVEHNILLLVQESSQVVSLCNMQPRGFHVEGVVSLSEAEFLSFRSRLVSLLFRKTH